MKVLHSLIKFWNIPYIEKKMLLEGFGLILLLTPVISFFPLKYYVGFLKSKPRNYQQEIIKKNCIKLVRKTIIRLERIVPVRLSCLVKSATFRILLNSLGVPSKIQLGVYISTTSILKAHACIIIDDKLAYLKRTEYTQVFTL
jgi:hypothetical protein